ncbi:MAG: hypothetical protein R2849_15955 [Thermomicrobiales bacterium]
MTERPAPASNRDRQCREESSGGFDLADRDPGSIAASVGDKFSSRSDCFASQGPSATRGRTDEQIPALH